VPNEQPSNLSKVEKLRLGRENTIMWARMNTWMLTS
jgi:hypothetical protein